MESCDDGPKRFTHCSLSAHYLNHVMKERVLQEIRRVSRYLKIGKVYEMSYENQYGFALIVEDVPLGEKSLKVLTPSTRWFAIISPAIPWREKAQDIHELDLQTGEALDGVVRSFDTPPMLPIDNQIYADLVRASTRN